MYASLMAVIGEPPSSCRLANATWHFHARGQKQVEVEGKPSGEELEVACEFISPFADMTQESRSPSPSLFRPQSCFNTTGKYVFPIFIPACMTEYMLYYDSSWDTVTGRHTATASASSRDAVRPIRLTPQDSPWVFNTKY